MSSWTLPLKSVSVARVRKVSFLTGSQSHLHSSVSRNCMRLGVEL